MDVSVIIPAYNEELYLTATIERIQHAFTVNEVKDTSWELIVCDNNSTDRTTEFAAEMGARVVFEGVNQISRARNTGAQSARGEWLLFIDADTYPPPELLSEVLKVFADDRYLGCGATIRVEGGTLFNKLRMERLNPLFRLFNWSGGAYLACRKDAFQVIGGFSTDLFAYEEIDYLIRLQHYGRSVGQKFKVLYRHPAITSGRKGDYTLLDLGRLLASNFLAVILFPIHYLLPTAVNRKLGSWLFGYWYNSRHE